VPNFVFDNDMILSYNIIVPCSSKQDKILTLFDKTM
jgi:hypothetical protein